VASRPTGWSPWRPRDDRYRDFCHANFQASADIMVLSAHVVQRSRITPADHRSQLIAVRRVGMDTNCDEAPIVGSLAARHN
jgi:hypothetical protein